MLSSRSFLRITLGSVLLFCALALGTFSMPVHAQTTEELEAQREASLQEIERLKAEIAELQKELNTTTEQKSTLQSAIKALEINIQKLQKSISLTNAQIAQKDKEIRTISGDITTTSSDIDRSREQIAESLRELESLDSSGTLVTILAGGTLSSFFDAAVSLSAVRSGLQNRIQDLSELRGDLQVDKTSAEQKRKELASLQNSLSQQRQGLNVAKSEQQTLLKETQNKESSYQSLIAEKQAQQQEFEAALRTYESQLGLEVSSGSFAAPGAGVLKWPVDNPYVTQSFGNTPFATANAQVYGGRGHNAIDLRAPVGTPIKAARGGTIKGTGNTDSTCPNASYGKWVFIEHDNGLSTLYAHLSTISVTQGQSVATGQLIGYSGSTGYATGPHLHFGVYATAGSKIASFPSQSCKGKTYTMPLADPTAYLNPLSYLPR